MPKFKFLITPLALLPHFALALPFTIIPAAGTTLPTQLNPGQTTTAYYTIINNTSSLRIGNFIKYLPTNVTQIVANNTCGTTFTLPSGGGCTLRLLVSGAVNGNDPDPKHHLFACFPGGLTCAGTLYPLNVSVLRGNNEFVAGGLYFNNSEGFIGLARSTNSGATWSSQSLTPPAGYYNGQVIGMSCSGDICVGVGNYSALSANQSATIVRSADKGATWSQLLLSAPAGFNSGIFEGINCNGSICVSVGGSINNMSSNTQATIGISRDAGITWSQQILPLLSGIQNEFLAGITCTGSFCISVGGYVNGSFITVPGVAISRNGGQTWSQQILALPSSYQNGTLNGVSCTNSTCIAVGGYEDSSDDSFPAVAISQDSGTTWNQQVLTPPDSFVQGNFKGINCTNSYCVAVGAFSYGVNYTGYPAIALTTNNGVSWLQQTLSIPTGYVYGYLNGVRCENTTCIASGYYTSNSFAAMPFVAVSADSGRSWSQQLLPPPNSFAQGIFSSVG